MCKTTKNNITTENNKKYIHIYSQIEFSENSACELPEEQNFRISRLGGWGAPPVKLTVSAGRRGPPAGGVGKVKHYLVLSGRNPCETEKRNSRLRR